MKIICKNCGYIDEEERFPTREVELKYRIDDCPRYKPPLYCPKCNSEELDDADFCKDCKKYFPFDKIKNDACPECPECRKLNEEKELN